MRYIVYLMVGLGFAQHSPAAHNSRLDQFAHIIGWPVAVGRELAEMRLPTPPEKGRTDDGLF